MVNLSVQIHEESENTCRKIFKKTVSHDKMQQVLSGWTPALTGFVYLRFLTFVK